MADREKRGEGPARLRAEASAGLSAARRKGARPDSLLRWTAPTLTVLFVLVAWQAACTFEVVPSFLLPSPLDVALTLVNDAPLLASHALVTLGEALAGLACGVAAGFLLAMAMDRFAVVDKALSPLVTISQTIPTVAIAPLLVLWLGYGMLPKVLLVALTTFFPITVSLASGFRSVDPDVIDLMRTMNASWWQMFRFAKLPAAADSFFAGLRISATYAVVGAVVAEWLGGFEGLGVYMTRVRKSYRYDQMFAVIFIISALSLLLMGAVRVLERACMPWKRVEKHEKPHSL
ncbi:ABC transporter permease [Xiamenia xianingshaonis]|uniref:ABC transporter permease n=1 Tax=Xiamenia xianingshaonis TaxID=2682776 RepID=A0A9E6MQP4_9ACTN|nr:ABC transporter permease [Xiamenia xianingshaonis]NHM14170.1 ABC transporter permease subunit [Xiamenia xianingshaonis]QTU84215.1 ABC transporter permease [Xiamenia xianingshaonis]